VSASGLQTVRTTTDERCVCGTARSYRVETPWRKMRRASSCALKARVTEQNRFALGLHDAVVNGLRAATEQRLVTPRRSEYQLVGARPSAMVVGTGALIGRHW
jgi:hypothetical protein